MRGSGGVKDHLESDLVAGPFPKYSIDPEGLLFDRIFDRVVIKLKEVQQSRVAVRHIARQPFESVNKIALKFI